jgi:transposase, IS30 family
MQKIQKRDPFTHLQQKHRDRIHALYLHGHTQKHIAEVLGVTPGTISRELNRYGKTTWRYSSARAQKDAEEKRTHSKRDGMKVESNLELKERIIRELKELRAPDEIAGRMKKEKLSVRVGTNAIYKWLYSDYGKKYCRYLCSRKTRPKKQSRAPKRHLIPNRISLRHRPDDELQVHGESDLFVSPTSLHTKTVGHLTVIPSTHLLVGSFLPNKSPTVMVASMKRIQKKVKVTTWTMDNGIENIYHEQFGIPTFFCTKGSPWQKPHVESSIGLLRRWFLKKGTDLSKVTEEELQSMFFTVNHKYRKSLGYRSSYEESLESGIITKVPPLSRKKAIAFR